MITIKNISYSYQNSELLFDNISFTINEHDKIALIGHNGIGKSTLLKIISGTLKLTSGDLYIDSTPYYIPQIFGQFNHLTIAQVLKIKDKLQALREIIDGNITEKNLNILNDDWTIEERCREALNYWKLDELNLSQKMESLSGGQRTKVFLTGIYIHKPDIILFDEPSNHLDDDGRQLLYDFISKNPASMLIVSHDRTLLNLIDSIYELTKKGVNIYGGNYDFYQKQNQIVTNALNDDIKNKEKTLKKVKELNRKTSERKSKLDARGKKKQENAGIPKIIMGTLKNNAENSAARLKDTHTKKIGAISKELIELKNELPDIDKMKFRFDNSSLHRGKILFNAKDINYGYNDKLLWAKPLTFQITSGERIALHGSNGSGKTTLIKIILDELQLKIGSVFRADNSYVYIDQDYSLIDNNLNIYEQAQKFNYSILLEHEIKTELDRFLFTRDVWYKSCGILSGGEKMRLMLCCLSISNKAPDMIVLDEPTNNLDIQNIEILTAAINEYKGSIIVVSHDKYFLEEINIEITINLE
ncbi:MAG: ATP-binding cassette domain-containing protein [Fusobacteriaceae bacterium]|jgi:ATPase subunit of ABC transporter with duplicated ATPase domains|nr:ATP-binding cassette domain-containing protein [Fusobacteriaceae bacterium]